MKRRKTKQKLTVSAKVIMTYAVGSRRHVRIRIFLSGGILGNEARSDVNRIITLAHNGPWYTRVRESCRVVPHELTKTLVTLRNQGTHLQSE